MITKNIRSNSPTPSTRSTYPRNSPLDVLFNTNDDDWGPQFGEIALGTPKTCRLGLRCLYPLVADDLCPDEFPGAFSVDTALELNT